MAAQDDLSRTMRIDVSPDVEDATAADLPLRSWTLSGSADVEFRTRQHRTVGRSADYIKILQSVYDAVLITDAEGILIDFNYRALDFFLCKENDLSGGSIIDLISGADQTLLDALSSNLDDHRYTLIEARCQRSDYTLFPAEIAVSRINLDSDHELCFFVRDVTVRKQAQEALEDAVARLEAHDKARSQFISNVSHELRTPLTSMIYAVANMQRGVVGELPARAADYLSMLEADAKRLLNTVNDILDIRKIEDSSLELNSTRLAFSHLVQRSAQSLLVQARRQSISMPVPQITREQFVDGDGGRLERMLTNIIGNAVKFTPEGGRIEVEQMMDPDRDAHVLTVVRDNGIGIPPDAVSKVMLRYFTVGEQASGTGLGLAISKEIVELHGGHLDIVSPPPGFEQGTQVSISLPVVDPPLVLIVDDDEAVCELLRQQAEEGGFQVCAAKSGPEALRYLAAQQPRVMVTDIALPEMSGIELIMKTRDLTGFKKLPVIVVTGVRVRPAQEEILKTLGIPILAKPWSEAELLDRLAEVFMVT